MPTDEQRAVLLSVARVWLNAEALMDYRPNREAYVIDVDDEAVDSLATLLASREAAARAGAVEECKAIVERAAIQTGYGFFQSDNPHEFRPDPECTTEQERENHRLACEAYDRGEPIPAQNFTPDASTFVNGVLVHQTGGPWGIGTYTFKDDAFSGALDELRTLAATPPDRVVVARDAVEQALDVGDYDRVVDIVRAALARLGESSDG